MTFQNIKQRFTADFAGRDRLRRDLRNPNQRLFFDAVRIWINENLAPETPAGAANLVSALWTSEAQSFARQVGQLHLDLAQNRRWIKDEDARTPNPSLKRIAEKYQSLLGHNPFDRSPIGPLLDFEEELTSPPDAWVPQPNGHLQCGLLRKASHSVVVPLLFAVTDEQDPKKDHGLFAKLEMEWVPRGQGDFYPIPALWFVERKDDFKAAEEQAVAYLMNHGLWPEKADIRWRIWLPSGHPWGLTLTGPSVGAQFALALLKLFSVAQPNKGLPIPDVRKLESPHAVITAKFNASDGSLGQVGKVFLKLAEAARASLPPLKLLISSPHEESLKELNAESRRWIQFDTAATLEDAVKKMLVYQETSWKGPRLPNLPECSIQRAAFIQGVRDHVAEIQKKTRRGYLVVWGGMGRGKTTAMIQLVEALQRAGSTVVFHFLQGSSDTPGEVASKLLDQLCLLFPDCSPRERDPSRAHLDLKNLLRRISDEKLSEFSREPLIICIDAADQINLDQKSQNAGFDKFITGVLDDLPAGVICVITSRFKTDWLQWSAQMTDLEFAPPLVDDRADIRDYLAARGSRFLTPSHIERITSNPGCIPVFYSVAKGMEILESPRPAPTEAESARLKKLYQETIEPWLAEPAHLVKETLQRIVTWAGLKPKPVPESRVWEILHYLALSTHRQTDSGEEVTLSDMMLKELGLWKADVEKVLKLSGGLIRRETDWSELTCHNFDHPGVRRAMLFKDPEASKLELRMDHRPIYGQLVQGCARCWREKENLAREFSLRMLPTALREAGLGRVLAKLLCDLGFIVAKVQAGLVAELMLDYEQALAAHHDVLEKNEKGHRTPLAGKRIARASQALETPTQLRRLRAFADFVYATRADLSKFNEYPGFVLQCAMNYSPQGPVRQTAERLITKAKPPMLLRQFSPTDTNSLDRLRSLTGHIDEITCVAVTPDGKRAISASDDGTLILWDPMTNQFLRVLGHRGKVSSMGLSPDGKRAVLVSDDGTIKFWDIEDDVCLHTLERQGIDVISVVVMPENKRVVSAFADGTLKLLDLDTGTCLRTLVVNSDKVNSVAVMPVDQRSALVLADGNLKLLDLESGACLRTLQGNGGKTSSVVVAPDRRRALSSSEDGAINLWDLETGSCLRALQRRRSKLRALTLTPDSTRAVLVSDRDELVFLDLRKDVRYKGPALKVDQILTVSSMFEGAGAVWVLDQGELRLLGLGTGVSLRSLNLKRRWIPFVALMSDGRRAVLVSGKDASISVLNLETGNRLRTTGGYGHAVACLDVAPDGSRAVCVVSGERCRIETLDLKKGLLPRACGELFAWISSVVLVPNSTHAVLGTDDGTIMLWHLKKRACLRNFAERHRASVAAMAVTQDGKQVVSASDDSSLKVWELASGACLHTLEGHSDSVSAVAVSPSGLRAISGSRDSTLRIWELRNGRWLHELKGHTGSIISVNVAPDGLHVISGSSDNTLRVWQLETGKCVAVFAAPFPIRCCAVLPHDRRIVTDASLGHLRILEISGIGSPFTLVASPSDPNYFGPAGLRSRFFTITNKCGMSPGPGTMFVEAANRHGGLVRVEKDGEVVDGKSIMGVMMLAAGPGSRIAVHVEEPNARVVLDELESLIRVKFHDWDSLDGDG